MSGSKPDCDHWLLRNSRCNGNSCSLSAGLLQLLLQTPGGSMKSIRSYGRPGALGIGRHYLTKAGGHASIWEETPAKPLPRSHESAGEEETDDCCDASGEIRAAALFSRPTTSLLLMGRNPTSPPPRACKSRPKGPLFSSSSPAPPFCSPVSTFWGKPW